MLWERSVKNHEESIARINSQVPTLTPYPISTFDTALMLGGFALENLVKGIIVAQNPSMVNNDKFNTSVTTHDLEALCELATFELDDNERDLIQTLQKVTVWMGRYPFSKTLSDGMARWEADFELYKTLYLKMYDRLNSGLWVRSI